MSTTLQPALTTPQTHVELFGQVANTLPGPARLRREALARFAELGFPTERNEDWKFTSVAPLVRTPFLLPPPDGEKAADAFRRNLLHEGPGVTLLHVNANRPFLLKGSGPLPQGVLVMSLAEALQRHPELVEPHLGRHADFNHHPFVALNTAFWQDGAFVYVPPGVVVETPIELASLVSSFNEHGPYLWYRRALVVLGRASQATVVERFGGARLQYATNAVTEVVLDEGAVLDHYKVQEEPVVGFHLACTQGVLARDGNFSTLYVGLGGGLVRNEARVLFTGENGEATVNGLYLAGGTQHADNHTVIDHAQPHCASHELYKGILDGKARGVFNGKIYVRQDAQKTDAKQTNQTLLLSDDATINTKPQLEIFADDVKCTHGATVGQLDADALFYLRTRGLGPAEARALLTFAFANDVIGRVKVPALRDRLEKTLLSTQHLPRPESPEES
jgi:Fe-S cluster assembly protein SufD